MTYKRVIDELYRIVLPRELCEFLSVKKGDSIYIQYEENNIKICSTKSICKLCGEPIDNNADIQLCTECLIKAKNTILRVTAK